jgi:two-component system response regulator RegX3
MTGHSRRVLVVAGTESTSVIQEELLNAGFDTITVTDPQSARQHVEQNGMPHLLIVHLEESDDERLNLCRDLYDVAGLPIITIADDDSTELAVRALKYADDHIRQQYVKDELVVRARRILSRIQDFRYADRPALEVFDWFFYDNVKNEITVKGRTKKLTPTENSILRILLKYKGKVIDTATLIERVWQADPTAGSENALRVHIHRLRHKIERNPSAPRVIFTARGDGYTLNSSADPGMA